MIPLAADYVRWLFAGFLQPDPSSWLHTHLRQVWHLAGWVFAFAVARSIYAAWLQKRDVRLLAARQYRPDDGPRRRGRKILGQVTSAERLAAAFPELHAMFRRYDPPGR